MDWYLKVLKNYVGFEGRARRKEYWMFVLFNVLISIGLQIIDRVIGTFSHSAGMGLLSGLYALAVFLPGLAVSIRRLHDLDKSGWLLLLALIPCVGAVVLIVWFAMEGTRGPNQYGPDPKGSETGAALA